MQGSYIGTNVSGAVAAANGTGVEIASGGENNTIGGTTASARNIISANAYSGVEIDDANDNLVEGDFIGTEVTGTVALGNNSVDVEFAGGVLLTSAPRQHHRRAHRDTGHRRGQPDLGQHLRGRVVG